MERVYSRDGTVIAYQKSGSGPPLLLVHGTSADHMRWAAITPRLEQRFTVYAMDRRGRGESGDAESYSILREAEDVAAVVEAAGEPVNLLGHSFGALISLETALLTKKIIRMVLYEPPLGTSSSAGDADIVDRMEALINRGEFEPALEVFMREVVFMPEHEFEVYRRLPMWSRRIRLAPTIPREKRAEEAYVFDPERFSKIRVPSMLLLGGDSPPHVRQDVESVRSALPNSQIVILPDQQHIAMDTAPDLFVRVIIGFLSS